MGKALLIAAVTGLCFVVVSQHWTWWKIVLLVGCYHIRGIKHFHILIYMRLTARPVWCCLPNIIHYVNNQFLRCGQMCCMCSFLFIWKAVEMLLSFFCCLPIFIQSLFWLFVLLKRKRGITHDTDFDLPDLSCVITGM